MVFCCLVTLVVLILLGAFLFPGVLKGGGIGRISCKAFLAVIRKGRMSGMRLGKSAVCFASGDGRPGCCRAAAFSSPGLMGHLRSTKYRFKEITRRRVGPLLDFFLM